MSLIHAELVERMFFGDDAVLLAMEDAGVDGVATVVRQAAQHGPAQLDYGVTVHLCVIEAGAADVPSQP